MASDPRIRGLVLAHVVLGLLSGTVASDLIPAPSGLVHIPIVPFFALVFCQVGLLAFWAVFPSGGWWKRLGVLLAGVALLEALFEYNIRNEFFLMPSLTALLAAGALLVMRARGVRLRLVTGVVDSQSRASGRFQFSIRGIMLLTLVVALLSAGARTLWSTHGPNNPAITFLWSLCFAVVGLLALRAALAHDLRAGRVLFVMALSPVLGAFVAFIAQAHQAGWVYLITIMVLEPALLLGSLWVVRSCGYRLVGGPAFWSG